MKYLRIIASLILTILTLGVYARYQANKAKFSEQQAREAINALDQSNKRIERINKVSNDNAKSLNEAMQNTVNRSYFDKRGNRRLSNKDTTKSKF